jgi:hypothetical protein
MSIDTKSAPCWRLVLPDGTDYDQGEGIRHHDTEHEATTEIRDLELPTGTTAQQYPSPCASMSCDECGVDLGGDEAFTEFHCEGGEPQIREVAKQSDWNVTPDGRCYCWDCPVPEVLADEHA